MTVRSERDGPVTTIIIDRHHARNAVDPETAERLVAEFEIFDADLDASVAVFFGDNGVFCAGWDLKYASTGRGELETAELAFPTGDGPVPRSAMGPARMKLDKPVIGAIAGAAVAGGMELALWCDVRIMEEDAYLGVYCRRWGIPLIDGGTVRLPRLVGMGRAQEIVLTGRKVPADECLAIGLCEKVVPTGEARQAAEEMAREIARFPQECVRADRRSLYAQQGLPEREALMREWYNGVQIIEAEGADGAARFVTGAGRHGDFSKV
jgi:enoyl-CoA hydratase